MIFTANLGTPSESSKIVQLISDRQISIFYTHCHLWIHHFTITNDKILLWNDINLTWDKYFPILVPGFITLCCWSSWDPKFGIPRLYWKKCDEYYQLTNIRENDFKFNFTSAVRIFFCVFGVVKNVIFADVITKIHCRVPQLCSNTRNIIVSTEKVTQRGIYLLPYAVTCQSRNVLTFIDVIMEVSLQCVCVSCYCDGWNENHRSQIVNRMTQNRNTYFATCGNWLVVFVSR